MKGIFFKKKEQIAEQLEISQNTVADHVKRIYKKLGVQNSPAAITKAFQAGILPVEGEEL